MCSLVPSRLSVLSAKDIADWKSEYSCDSHKEGTKDDMVLTGKTKQQF